MITYIGIDNGVSGSIGVISEDQSVIEIFDMPTISEQSYTKTKKNITRIDWHVLTQILAKISTAKVFLERPMVNPGRFMATMSALRALEATLICVEAAGFPLTYVDSKQWQKVMLPAGIKGADEQKKASLDIGKRIFPQFSEFIEDHGDADGLLMAEWARRNKL